MNATNNSGSTEDGFTTGQLVKKVFEMERETFHVTTNIEARLRVLEKDVEDIPVQIAQQGAQIREQIKDFVTKARFYPVELIAYGLVAGVMLTVLGAVLGRVLIK